MNINKYNLNFINPNPNFRTLLSFELFVALQCQILALIKSLLKHVLLFHDGSICFFRFSKEIIEFSTRRNCYSRSYFPNKFDTFCRRYKNIL